MTAADRVEAAPRGPAGGWSIVMPLKPPRIGKTRLRHPAADPASLANLADAADQAITQLVLAMALDTVAAAIACPVVHRVILVCDDRRATEQLLCAGAEVLADRPAAGINAALRHGASTVPADRPVACLMPDLPALRPVELASALVAAELAIGTADGSGAGTPEMAFVSDAAGTGTVLLASARAGAMRPAFGERSASAHLAAGALQLSGWWPGLVTDVDLAGDLDRAARLSLGRHTAAALASWGQP